MIIRHDCLNCEKELNKFGPASWFYKNHVIGKHLCDDCLKNSLPKFECCVCGLELEYGTKDYGLAVLKFLRHNKGIVIPKCCHEDCKPQQPPCKCAFCDNLAMNGKMLCETCWLDDINATLAYNNANKIPAGKCACCDEEYQANYGNKYKVHKRCRSCLKKHLECIYAARLQ
jgi:hypothetical protein